MKHLFGIFIPLCICSFIAFGISVAILGVESSAAFDGDTDTADNSWTRTIERKYSDIDIDAGWLAVKIIPADTDITTIKYEGHSAESDIVTEVKGDTLKVDAGTFVSFMGIDKLIDNIVNGIKNGFMFDFAEASLEITVPDKVYRKLDISEGSGNITVNGIEAREYDFDIGSGALYFTGGDWTAELLDLDHGAGYFSLENVRTEKYDIDVGSGTFDISGLTGKGKFSMGSGTGTLGFGNVNGNSEIDIGSGSLTVELPSDTNAVITADIGSGSVRVNACGKNTAIVDKQKVTLGDGGYEINTDLGSGRVRFVEADSAGSTTDEYEEAVVTTGIAVAVELP